MSLEYVLEMNGQDCSMWMGECSEAGIKGDLIFWLERLTEWRRLILRQEQDRMRRLSW